MDEDVADTVATYQDVAEEYRKRHGDRGVVTDQVEWFLDALDDPDSPARPAPDAGQDPGDDGRPRVLDVGCGPGWETATLADRGCAPVGIDLAPRFLRMAREEVVGEETAAAFCRMDMRHLGIADGSVDGIWACASFLHVPREDAPATLREFRRVARDGAPLQLAVKRGEGRAAGRTYDDDRRRFTLWTREALTDLLEAVGFDVLRATDGEWIAVTARARSPGTDARPGSRERQQSD